VKPRDAGDNLHVTNGDFGLAVVAAGEGRYPSPCFAAGWSSSVARRAHNPKVVGSNPTPATMGTLDHVSRVLLLFGCGEWCGDEGVEYETLCGLEVGGAGHRSLRLAHRLMPMDEQSLDQFRGRWVALSADGEVVADAAELDELLALVECEGPRPDLVLQRLPEADTPMFVGLG
jgi:hypothetical protein